MTASEAAASDPAVQLVQQFYGAFARRDGAAMAALYAPDAVFSDGAFGTLSGVDAGRMWQMLCQQGKDLRVVLDRAERTADRDGLAQVSAQWTANYTFSATGRPVVNVIQATLTLDLSRGVIVEHHDVFSFWRWSRQALGPIGLVMGWSGWLQGQVRRRALKSLALWKPA
ncbi:MAG: nuclear transport factor 2 family protein [Deltaproteobacteria bacterium]|nr:nuclear transport factor 2 family protein [Deltaproteobacteria bacterium]